MELPRDWNLCQNSQFNGFSPGFPGSLDFGIGDWSGAGATVPPVFFTKTKRFFEPKIVFYTKKLIHPNPPLKEINNKLWKVNKKKYNIYIYILYIYIHIFDVGLQTFKNQRAPALSLWCKKFRNFQAFAEDLYYTIPGSGPVNASRGVLKSFRQRLERVGHTHLASLAAEGMISNYMEVSKNRGTQQPWVFLLKMIILGCFGITTI